MMIGCITCFVILFGILSIWLVKNLLCMLNTNGECVRVLNVERIMSRPPRISLNRGWDSVGR